MSDNNSVCEKCVHSRVCSRQHHLHCINFNDVVDAGNGCLDCINWNRKKTKSQECFNCRHFQENRPLEFVFDMEEIKALSKVIGTKQKSKG